jgi:uncharacterized protein YndB with AHSA1/START domain
VIRVQESVVIGRLVEEVFCYTSNPENFPQWAATVREVRRDSPGRDPLREGGRFTATQKALGRSFEAPFEVIDYEPNRRYAHWGTEGHPVPVTMVFAYERLSSDGTRFTPLVQRHHGSKHRLAGTSPKWLIFVAYYALQASRKMHIQACYFRERHFHALG